jgi:cardiolipin synthase
MRLLRQLPNLVSFARILLTPLVVMAILARDERAAVYWAAAACVTDAIDGELARLFHWRSRLGAYLDPIADKILLSAVYIAFGVTGVIPWWLVAMVFFRDILILLAAGLALVFTGMRPFAPSIWGKISTCFQMATAMVALIHKDWLPALIWATAAATLWSGLHYAWREAGMLRKAAT